MDIQSIPAFVQIIANYGFPAFISFYLLFRLEVKLEKITQATTELVSIIKDFQKEAS
ncbi:hypothetical protein HNP21_006434 [Bacillus aryabhattai]|uniref:YvrJ family protein n=1 Tax=Priestia aryabhattai TaxID=412384 RepID=A0A7W3NHR6_PRIAR|nr:MULTISPECIES: YvrJ family protein [Priestia]MBA9043238.1 hypothetical protein [Priestia aryabhattai]MEB4889027.1 YvrJ family protein [Priestia megaterium]